MALIPPVNTAGIPRPAYPTNPPSLGDITNAQGYIDRLTVVQRTLPNANMVTVEEIGQAELYKAAVVFGHQPGGEVGPPWLNVVIQNFTNQINNLRTDLTNQINGIRADLTQQINVVGNQVAQIQNDLTTLTGRVDNMQQDFARLPVLLANSTAGHTEALLDPRPQFAWQPLAAPNPTSRDELLTHFTHANCVASAANLGLPALPQGTTLPQRRRQIATFLGIRPS